MTAATTAAATSWHVLTATTGTPGLCKGSCVWAKVDLCVKHDAKATAQKYSDSVHARALECVTLACLFAASQHGPTRAQLFSCLLHVSTCGGFGTKKMARIFQSINSIEWIARISHDSCVTSFEVVPSRSSRSAAPRTAHHDATVFQKAFCCVNETMQFDWQGIEQKAYADVKMYKLCDGKS